MDARHVDNHIQRCQSSLSKLPEKLENFLEKCIFLFFCTGVNEEKFPEIDSLSTKFPEFRKFPEKWHLCASQIIYNEMPA